MRFDEVEEKGIVKYWKRTHFTQKSGAGPHGTKWEKIFFTSGSAAQLKIHEKSGFLLMVPLPYLNF